MDHRTTIRTFGALMLAVGLGFAAPAHGSAQDVSAGWLPFLGCWEPVDAPDEGLLCVRPEAGGVQMFTMVDGEVVTSDVLAADGLRHERSAEGCEGWESADFSADGRRVFTRSEFVCGEELPRTSTGVMSMVTPTDWLDVRSVDVDGESMAWVRRYRVVGPDRMAETGIEDITSPMDMSVRTARISASRAISVEAVHEAAAVIDTKAVEAWVAARGDGFDLDAEELVRVADAGMPESVIDVMVAVSYPEHFSIDGGGDAEARPLRGGSAFYDDDRCRSGRSALGVRSFYWNPFYYGYGGRDCYRRGYSLSPYGYGYNGYGYSPYAYGGYGYGGYGYIPTTVIVDRAEPESRGRAVNGRGYTRGGTGSGGAVRGSSGPRTQSGGSGGASAAPRSGGSSQPASSGSTGRKAKPRGGR